MLTGHGNDIYDFADKITGDFSSNIPYKNCGEQVAAHLRQKMHLIGNYPDPNAAALTRQIARHHGISAENILVTNGSAEAFYLLAHLFSGEPSTIAIPSFAEYEDACTLYRHKLSFFPVADFSSASSFECKTVWFAVPNNPDGEIIAPETIDNLCRTHRHTFFIADNAYGELCPACRPIVPLHARNSNFISVHSLTKTFAIPGLRLGYIVAHETIIKQLQPLRTPWTVNALALEAGGFVMRNYSRLLPDSQALCRESAEFQQQLALVPQLEIVPSRGNYFLVRMKTGTAAHLKSYLIENHGLLIRNADNFRGLSAQHFRLSVQESAMNARLIEALKQYFSR